MRNKSIGHYKKKKKKTKRKEKKNKTIHGK